MEAAALATTNDQAALAAVPAKSRAMLMRAQMEAETEIRALLAEYVERNMIDGVDYGRIPGTPKPTLLKPGAEKLVDLFRCEPQYEITQRVERWDDAAPLFHYEFRCKIVERDGGRVLAEGFGSANSREGRYRWRNADRKCPACNKPTIIKGKEEYGGGWLCFAKKGGCGAKYADNAPEIVDQQIGKVENDDVFTLVNTVLKMAKKRALVDGAIALARCSNMFTQDVEDMNGAHGDDAWQAPRDNDAPREARREQRASDRPPPASAPRTARSSSRQQPPPQRRNSGPVMPYGKHKGKPANDPKIPIGDLHWMAERMTEALQKPDNQYRESNRALLDVLQEEILRREDNEHAAEDAEQQYDDRPPPRGFDESDDIPF